MPRVINIIGVMVLTAFVAVLLPLTVPKLFGLKLYSVLSGSMEPEIPVHSVIYVKKADAHALEVGDVICFRIGSGTDITETHRIVSVSATGGSFVTKGDANKENDVSAVPFGAVAGKVIFSIPVLGIISDTLHSPKGTAACVFGFAAIFLMFAVSDRRKPKEKRNE